MSILASDTPMFSMDVPMIFPDDTARTRRSDPITSHEAADSNDVHGSKAYVLALLRHYGPQADFEIEEAHRHELGQFDVPLYSPSRLRTARSALVNEGLVEFTGMYHLTDSGRRARVWQVTA